MGAANRYTIHESQADLAAYQLHKLNQLLVFASQHNAFYKEKLEAVRLPLRSLNDLQDVPFTTKKELAAEQTNHPPYGRNHSYPETSYIRYHQTSGTSGRPLKVLDTKESWDWWQECWMEVLQTAGVTASDRVFIAFSFGPFIGFWAAYEAAKRMGALVIPGGGQSTHERLFNLMEHRATVLICTPSYALHMLEASREYGHNLKESAVRLIVTGGEPGGSIPSVRERIESGWNASLFDHAGASEVGAHSYSCSARGGLHINESQFIGEIIDPVTLEPVKEGEEGELVITNLGRYGFPVIRYRTGDAVRKSSGRCSCGSEYQFFPGGIIGRCDDMVIVRGINIFPQSIEAIVREFSEIEEFRIIYYVEDDMNQVKVQIESEGDVLNLLKIRLRERLGLRIEVEKVPAGSLPRFELKARRVLDQRVPAK